MRRLDRPCGGALILDDFALRPLDATETNDFYECVVERHRKASTIVTSNPEPSKAADHDERRAAGPVRPSTASPQARTSLIIEGPSYRQRTRPNQRVGIDSEGEARDAH
jgi:DNA replication protein DnaC